VRYSERYSVGTCRSYNSNAPETEYEAKDCGNNPQKNDPYIFMVLVFVLVFIAAP
jgi:hypothetical protein